MIMIQRWYSFCPIFKKWFFTASQNGLTYFGEKGSLFYEMYVFGKLESINVLKYKNVL